MEDEPGLVDAVRSLLDQSPRPEIVVVNSGGGDPEPRLRAAGLEVPVVNLPTRVLPGAARNVAVEHTAAPVVAFLAADCVAEPGWVAARLAAHRAGAAAVASILTVGPTATRSACAAHLLLHNRRMRDTPGARRLHYGLSYDRAVLARVGPFREDLRQGEDSELNARLGPADPVVWSDAVRTRHRHPSRPLALLRDQYVRGRRRAIAQAQLAAGPTRWSMRAHTVTSVRQALRQIGRTVDPRERRQLRRATPILVPAALAYALGGWTASRGAGRSSKLRAGSTGASSSPRSSVR